MSSVLEARVVALEARLAAVEARLAGGGAPNGKASGGGAVADDNDLDSEWGDPLIKKDPPRWQGESYAGCRMSECPSDYLDVIAKLFDWMASKDDEQGRTYKNKQGKEVATAPFKRKDAARARGWAQRNRTRQTAVPSAGDEQGSSGESDDDIPF